MSIKSIHCQPRHNIKRVNVGKISIYQDSKDCKSPTAAKKRIKLTNHKNISSNYAHKWFSSKYCSSNCCCWWFQEIIQWKCSCEQKKPLISHLRCLCANLWSHWEHVDEFFYSPLFHSVAKLNCGSSLEDYHMIKV